MRMEQQRQVRERRLDLSRKHTRHLRRQHAAGILDVERVGVQVLHDAAEPTHDPFRVVDRRVRMVHGPR